MLEITANTDAVVAMRGVVGRVRTLVFCENCGNVIAEGSLAEWRVLGRRMRGVAHIGACAAPEPDPTPDPVDGWEERVEARVAVTQALRALPERERLVLALRYGIGADGDVMTLDSIGQHLGLTRERVRQIQREAERRLLPLLGRTHPDDEPLPTLEEIEEMPAPTFDVEALVPDWLAA